MHNLYLCTLLLPLIFCFPNSELNPVPKHKRGIRPAQAIGVRGILLCNGRPESDVLVKLYDHDTFTLDDLIAKGKTDYNGNFQIAGHEHEISRITPKLNIYHDCNDWWPCQRKISIYVPKAYITPGKYADYFYNVGVIELSVNFTHI
uniref:Uncharacterized protein n=1 Tax=Acrobeloides nanus TaxID=290746 RepID=A0A914CX88_9BILA